MVRGDWLTHIEDATDGAEADLPRRNIGSRRDRRTDARLGLRQVAGRDRAVRDLSRQSQDSAGRDVSRRRAMPATSVSSSKEISRACTGSAPHMASGGRIHIHGPPAGMSAARCAAGEIHVEGDAGGWAGAEMHGGLHSRAGKCGPPGRRRLSRLGQRMTGGTILVDGNAGNEIGLTMRRGLIAIGGSAGRHARLQHDRRDGARVRRLRHSARGRHAARHVGLVRSQPAAAAAQLSLWLRRIARSHFHAARDAA